MFEEVKALEKKFQNRLNQLKSFVNFSYLFNKNYTIRLSSSKRINWYIMCLYFLKKM